MRLNKRQKRGHNQTIIIRALTGLTYMGVLVVLLACAGAAAGDTTFVRGRTNARVWGE